MLCKKAVLKNFAIHYIQENICVGVPFEIKLQAFRPANLLKKRPQHRCFPVRIAKFLRASVLKNIYERLLLCRLHKARCTLSSLSFAYYSGKEVFPRKRLLVYYFELLFTATCRSSSK